MTIKNDVIRILQLTGRRLLYPDRRTVVFCYDVGVCMISMQLAYWLYYGENQIYFSEFFILKQMAIYGCLCASTFALLQTYRPLWKYLNLFVVVILAIAVAIASGVHSALEWRFNVENIRIHPLLSFIAGSASFMIMIISRLIYKFSLRWTLTAEDNELTSISDTRILIYGHSKSIRDYLTSLKLLEHSHIDVLGIVSDSPARVGETIAGYSIVCTLADLEDYISELNAEGQHPHKLIVSPEKMMSFQVRQLFDVTCRRNMYLQKIPAPQDVTHEGILPIKLELQDLFSDPLHIDVNSPLGDYFSQQNIMIIGAGGPVGLNLIHQLTQLNVNNLIICESDQGLLAELRDCSDLPNIHYIFTKGYTAQHFDHLMHDYKPSVLINLDSITEQAIAIENPLETLYENLLVPVTLAKLAQKNKVAYFINTRPTFLAEDQTIITPINNIFEAWCQDHDNINAATRFVTIHLPTIIFQQDEWIRFLRNHAKQGRSSIIYLKSTLDNLMAPNSATFLLLRTIYLFTQTQLAKASLGQVQGATVSPEKLLRIIKNLFHLNLDKITVHTTACSGQDARFIVQTSDVNIENETIQVYKFNFEQLPVNIDELLSQLTVVYQKFDKQTALDLIFNKHHDRPELQ